MNIRLHLRFLLPLLLVLTGSAWLALNIADKLTMRWFLRDLNLRGEMLASAQSDTIYRVFASQEWSRIHRLFERTLRDERLAAMALCAPDGTRLHHTTDYPAWLSCSKAHDLIAARQDDFLLGKELVHLGVFPVRLDKRTIAELVLLHDMAFIERRALLSRQYLLVFVLTLGAVIALVATLLARQSLRKWSASIQALLRSGSTLDAPPPELAPFADDLRQRLRDLEDQCRRANGADSLWTAEHLRALLRSQLSGDELIIISNREPWSHEHLRERIVPVRPASGLVTAIEPIARACGATWIAHGSGTADKETVDAHDHIDLPPAQNDYRLRRIWLSTEEVRGYYDGLSNEGIWPLCHLAHVRPVFREQDWAHYRAINQRFADAVLAEARSRNPLVLVQDYQLALAPAMIRSLLPEATIISFWHIPWPTAEAFGICPWRREILQGLLGSTIIGFQTALHRENFLGSVDRFLEARIERERSSVFCAGRETLVATYPISIEWAGPDPMEQSQQRLAQRTLLGLTEAQRLIVGIDRLDYTKGIEERMLAFEHLLAGHPAWVGKLQLLQLAAPTRDGLREYAALQSRVEALAARINTRFGRPGYQPLSLLIEHRDPAAVLALYQAADACVVSSLHDGMNLVSKEFIAARSDEQGVLILSSFAGAASELTEALIVNPYHIEELAAAMHRALTMHPEEQRERMASLRMQVREANVYRWAGNMLNDAARWRLRERVGERVRRYEAD